jgi:hypothetical protein
MRTYVLLEIATGKILEIKSDRLTAGQMKEISRDGFKIMAIK